MENHERKTRNGKSGSGKTKLTENKEVKQRSFLRQTHGRRTTITNKYQLLWWVAREYSKSIRKFVYGRWSPKRSRMRRAQQNDSEFHEYDWDSNSPFVNGYFFVSILCRNINNSSGFVAKILTIMWSDFLTKLWISPTCTYLSNYHFLAVAMP